jgi:hypothetical protein
MPVKKEELSIMVKDDKSPLLIDDPHKNKNGVQTDINASLDSSPLVNV